MPSLIRSWSALVVPAARVGALVGLPLATLSFLAACDGPGGDVCPAIALLCDEGYSPDDTDGDGCEDACVPDAQCEAIPQCHEGDVEVASSSDCLQDDAVCYELSLCGTTIWCTGPSSPPPVNCLDDSECADGERCDTENYCDSPTDCPDGLDCIALCYGRCVEAPVCEPEILPCAPDTYPVDTDGDGCADTCQPPLCDAYPSCDFGDTEVAGPSDCLQDDANCYQVSLCGSTIWCTGPAVQACWDDAGCDDGQRCDTLNYCEPSPDCVAGEACDAVCYGRCVDASEPPPGVVCTGNVPDCGDSGEPIDTDGDGCVDSCVEYFP